MSTAQHMPRPSLASPQRSSALDALAKAGKPLTTAEIALAAALPLQSAINVMHRLSRIGGLVANVGTPTRAEWMLISQQERKPSTPSAPSRFCNSSTPNMTARDLPSMGSTRPGAYDHLKAPSRRAEGMVSHQPPIIIGSNLAGGMR